MISWFKKLIRSLTAKTPTGKTSADSARARVGATGAQVAGLELGNAQRMPLSLVDEGRMMLKIKAAEPDMTDVELARRVGRRLDYVYKAMAEARNSYIAS